MNKAKACVITCIDFRFQDKIHTHLSEHHLLGAADIISLAGGTRDFIAPANDQDAFVADEQLELSISLHDPDTIAFIDHQDCGGYALDGTIPSGLSVEEDKEKHVTFFTQLKEILSKKYPSKQILYFYAPLDGKIEQVD